MNDDMKYLNDNNNNLKVIRTEILLTPLLVIFPLLIGFLLINDWYSRGFVIGVSDYDIELILGVIIIVVNIVFDIPFVKALIKRNKKLLFQKSKSEKSR
jgi:hypothetical protein